MKSEQEILNDLINISQTQYYQGSIGSMGVNIDGNSQSYNQQNAWMEMDNHDIRSQDSFFIHNANNDISLSQLNVTLTTDDIIVDKMHIHYGCKDENPVNRMRFFPKDADDTYIARKISESTYDTTLPRSFEELAIRVFVRDPKKERAAHRIFQIWCHQANSSPPFPTFSQRPDTTE